jgi:hypothetical protein
MLVALTTIATLPQKGYAYQPLAAKFLQLMMMT